MVLTLNECRVINQCHTLAGEVLPPSLLFPWSWTSHCRDFCLYCQKDSIYIVFLLFYFIIIIIIIILLLLLLLLLLLFEDISDKYYFIQS